jgi:hypothetical protein
MAYCVYMFESMKDKTYYEGLEKILSPYVSRFSELKFMINYGHPISQCLKAKCVVPTRPADLYKDRQITTGLACQIKRDNKISFSLTN